MSQTADTNLSSTTEDEISEMVDHIKRAQHDSAKHASRLDKEAAKLSAKIDEMNQQMHAFSQQLDQEIRDLALRMERRRINDQFVVVVMHNLGQNNGVRGSH